MYKKATIIEIVMFIYNRLLLVNNIEHIEQVFYYTK